MDSYETQSKEVQTRVEGKVSDRSSFLLSDTLQVFGGSRHQGSPKCKRTIGYKWEIVKQFQQFNDWKDYPKYSTSSQTCSFMDDFGTNMDFRGQR